jgi:hypothetical protein
VCSKGQGGAEDFVGIEGRHPVIGRRGSRDIVGIRTIIAQQLPASRPVRRELQRALHHFGRSGKVLRPRQRRGEAGAAVDNQVT